MFHTATEVEIELTWNNIGVEDIHVTHEPAGGEESWVEAKAMMVTEGIRLELPESRVAFHFAALNPLSVKWELVDGSGQFNLDGESYGWSQTGNVFVLDDDEVTFTYSESGIVIVGVLDIGGFGD
jgi:hypothetical protein